MEQSSISTNVTIDFNKKQLPKRPPTRSPSSASRADGAVPKKVAHAQPPVTFTPKQGEIPVKI